MAADFKNASANALLDQLDTLFPQGSILEIRSGGPPGAENAATGTVLVSIALPATPWAAASAGAKAKNGTWSAAAGAAGTAGHFRLKNAADTHRLEGTVGQGSGDCSLDNTNIASGQTVTINTFSVSLA